MAGSYLVLLLLAVLAVLTAGFVHLRLRAFTSSALKTSLARLVLIAVGIGCGYIAVRMYRGDAVSGALGFMIGFGVVHLPAACILLLKRARGEGPS
jgi:ABC-type uncharacterized transport system permease subunit